MLHDMTGSQNVLEALNRQELILRELLKSSRILDGRIRLVEVALGVHTGCSAYDTQSWSRREGHSIVGVPRDEVTDPPFRCIGTQPAITPAADDSQQETTQHAHLPTTARISCGAAVGEAADKHSNDGSTDQIDSVQPRPRAATFSDGRAISFMLRPGSFRKLLSGLRNSLNDGIDDASKTVSRTAGGSTGHFLRILSTKGASSSASDAMDDVEDCLWDKLSLSDFWHHLELFERAGVLMPLRHKLRLLTQVPHWVSTAALARMFREQDTVGILTNVVPPCEWGFLDTSVLFIFGIVHPASTFKIIWDVYVMAILFTVLIATPFVICFDIGYARISVLGIWEAIVDASLWLDMFLNFRTAFTEQSLHVDDALVTEYWRIGLEYLRGFFVLDFVSTVPWDLVNASLGLTQLFKISKVGKLVRVMRMLKITKMLRVVKAPKAFKQLELRLGRVLTRVLWLVCSVVFTLHIFACMFHFAALMSTAGGTWVESSGIVDATNTVDLYVTSMYWAMSTMATVGYGDVTPIQIAEKVVSMLGMLAGVTVFAYIMSTISVLLSSINAQSIRIAERQRQLDSFCRTHKIPNDLAMKLSQFYEYVLPREVHIEDSRILTGLSGTLRQQVLLTMHAPLIEKLPVLQSKHPQFLERALTNLKLEHYPPSEYVIWQGDMSTDMYFIVDGKLEVRINICDTEDKPAGTHQGSVATPTQPVAEARVVPLSTDGGVPGRSTSGGAGSNAGDLTAKDSDLPPVQRISRQLSKLRLRRTRRDTNIVNRMVGHERGPYKKVGRLVAGEHFGEVACWTGERRTASIVTVTSCELYSLQQTALVDLVALWPEFAVELKFKTVDGKVEMLPKGVSIPTSTGRPVDLNPSLRSQGSRHGNCSHRLSLPFQGSIIQTADASQNSNVYDMLAARIASSSKLHNIVSSSSLATGSQANTLLTLTPPAQPVNLAPHGIGQFTDEAVHETIALGQDCGYEDVAHRICPPSEHAASLGLADAHSSTSEAHVLQRRALALDITSNRSRQALPPLLRPAAVGQGDAKPAEHVSCVQPSQDQAFANAMGSSGNGNIPPG